MGSAVPAPRQPPLDAELTAFVADLRWEDVPADVRRRLAWLLLDFAAVCRAGRDAPASALAADHAVDAHGAGPATALLDGRMLSVPAPTGPMASWPTSSTTTTATGSPRTSRARW